VPTPRQYKDFEKTDIWQSILNELNVRIDLRHMEMEDPDGLLKVEDLYRAQGGIKAYKEIRDNLLESLIAMAEERTSDE